MDPPRVRGPKMRFLSPCSPNFVVYPGLDVTVGVENALGEAWYSC